MQDAAVDASHDLAWVVASPHRVKTASDEDWRPFGTRHALQEGSSRTACGKAMLVSRIFLDVAFNADHYQVCRVCAERVGSRRS